MAAPAAATVVVVEVVRAVAGWAYGLAYHFRQCIDVVGLNQEHWRGQAFCRSALAVWNWDMRDLKVGLAQCLKLVARALVR